MKKTLTIAKMALGLLLFAGTTQTAKAIPSPIPSSGNDLAEFTEFDVDLTVPAKDDRVVYKYTPSSTGTMTVYCSQSGLGTYVTNQFVIFENYDTDYYGSYGLLRTGDEGEEVDGLYPTYYDLTAGRQYYICTYGPEFYPLTTGDTVKLVWSGQGDVEQDPEGISNVYPTPGETFNYSLNSEIQINATASIGGFGTATFNYGNTSVALNQGDYANIVKTNGPPDNQFLQIGGYGMQAFFNLVDAAAQAGESEFTITIENVYAGGVLVSQNNTGSDYVEVENGTVSITYMLEAAPTLVSQTWPQYFYTDWSGISPNTATLEFSKDINSINEVKVYDGYLVQGGDTGENTITGVSLTPTISGSTVTLNFAQGNFSNFTADQVTVVISYVTDANDTPVNFGDGQSLYHYMDVYKAPTVTYMEPAQNLTEEISFNEMYQSVEIMWPETVSIANEEVAIPVLLNNQQIGVLTSTYVNLYPSGNAGEPGIGLLSVETGDSGQLMHFLIGSAGLVTAPGTYTIQIPEGYVTNANGDINSAQDIIVECIAASTITGTPSIENGQEFTQGENVSFTIAFEGNLEQEYNGGEQPLLVIGGISNFDSRYGWGSGVSITGANVEVDLGNSLKPDTYYYYLSEGAVSSDGAINELLEGSFVVVEVQQPTPGEVTTIEPIIDPAPGGVETLPNQQIVIQWPDGGGITLNPDSPGYNNSEEECYIKIEFLLDGQTFIDEFGEEGNCRLIPAIYITEDWGGYWEPTTNNEPGTALLISGFSPFDPMAYSSLSITIPEGYINIGTDCNAVLNLDYQGGGVVLDDPTYTPSKGLNVASTIDKIAMTWDGYWVGYSDVTDSWSAVANQIKIYQEELGNYNYTYSNPIDVTVSYGGAFSEYGDRWQTTLIVTPAQTLADPNVQYLLVIPASTLGFKDKNTEENIDTYSTLIEAIFTVTGSNSISVTPSNHGKSSPTTWRGLVISNVNAAGVELVDASKVGLYYAYVDNKTQLNTLEPVATGVEGSSQDDEIVVTFGDYSMTNGLYSIVISDGAFTGLPTAASNDNPVWIVGTGVNAIYGTRFTYEGGESVDINTVPLTIEPSQEESLESIEQVTVYWGENLPLTAVSSATASSVPGVLSINGQQQDITWNIVKSNIDSDTDTGGYAYSLVYTPAEALTAAGTYELVVPENSLYVNVNTYNPEVLNQTVTIIYIIEGEEEPDYYTFGQSVTLPTDDGVNAVNFRTLAEDSTVLSIQTNSAENLLENETMTFQYNDSFTFDWELTPVLMENGYYAYNSSSIGNSNFTLTYTGSTPVKFLFVNELAEGEQGGLKEGGEIKLNTPFTVSPEAQVWTFVVEGSLYGDIYLKTGSTEDLVGKGTLKFLTGIYDVLPEWTEVITSTDEYVYTANVSFDDVTYTLEYTGERELSMTLGEGIYTEDGLVTYMQPAEQKTTSINLGDPRAAIELTWNEEVEFYNLAQNITYSRSDLERGVLPAETYLQLQSTESSDPSTGIQVLAEQGEKGTFLYILVGAANDAITNTGEYQFTIPAGVVKNAQGAWNPQQTISVEVARTPVATISPAGATFLAGQNIEFTVTFEGQTLEINEASTNDPVTVYGATEATSAYSESLTWNNGVVLDADNMSIKITLPSDLKVGAYYLELLGEAVLVDGFANDVVETSFAVEEEPTVEPEYTYLPKPTVEETAEYMFYGNVTLDYGTIGVVANVEEPYAEVLAPNQTTPVNVDLSFEYSSKDYDSEGNVIWGPAYKVNIDFNSVVDKYGKGVYSVTLPEGMIRNAEDPYQINTEVSGEFNIVDAWGKTSVSPEAHYGDLFSAEDLAEVTVTWDGYSSFYGSNQALGIKVTQEQESGMPMALAADAVSNGVLNPELVTVDTENGVLQLDLSGLGAGTWEITIPSGYIVLDEATINYEEILSYTITDGLSTAEVLSPTTSVMSKAAPVHLTWNYQTVYPTATGYSAKLSYTDAAGEPQTVNVDPSLFSLDTIEEPGDDNGDIDNTPDNKPVGAAEVESGNVLVIDVVDMLNGAMGYVTLSIPEGIVANAEGKTNPAQEVMFQLFPFYNGQYEVTYILDQELLNITWGKVEDLYLMGMAGNAVIEGGKSDIVLAPYSVENTNGRVSVDEEVLQINLYGLDLEGNYTLYIPEGYVNINYLYINEPIAYNFSFIDGVFTPGDNGDNGDDDDPFGPSGVSALEAEAANSGVYNIQGMKISNTLKDLVPGIYIIGGKKVFVK